MTRILLLPLVLFACVSDVEPFVEPPTRPIGEAARVRLISTAESLGDFDVWIDSEKQSVGLPAGAVTTFVVDSGMRTVALTRAGEDLSAAVLSRDLDVADGEIAALVLFEDGAGGVSAQTVDDSEGAPPQGQVEVHYVNLQVVDGPQRASMAVIADFQSFDPIEVFEHVTFVHEARPVPLIVGPPDEALADHHNRGYTLDLQDLGSVVYTYQLENASGELELHVIQGNGAATTLQHEPVAPAATVHLAASLSDQSQPDALMRFDDYLPETQYAFGSSTGWVDLPWMESRSNGFSWLDCSSEIDVYGGSALAFSQVVVVYTHQGALADDPAGTGLAASPILLDDWGVPAGKVRLSVSALDYATRRFQIIDMNTGANLTGEVDRFDHPTIDVDPVDQLLGIDLDLDGQADKTYAISGSDLENSTVAGFGVHETQPHGVLIREDGTSVPLSPE